MNLNDESIKIAGKTYTMENVIKVIIGLYSPCIIKAYPTKLKVKELKLIRAKMFDKRRN